MFLNEGNRHTHRYRPLTTQLLIITLKYPLNWFATMCFWKTKKSKNRRNERERKKKKSKAIRTVVGWNVVARLESVYRLNNSVYNSWSFPSTPPSQFTAWGLLAHGHSVCSVTCSDQGYGTNWSLQYNFKHHTAFSSSQNLPLGKNLWFTGATKGESKTQNCIFKSSELKNRPRCRFYFSLFCWLCSCLSSLPWPST